MTDLAYVAVRYLHIAFAVLWMGAIVLMNVVFFPRVERLDPAGRKAFFATFGKPIARYGELSGFLAIGFGLLLYARLFELGTLVAGTAHANLYLAAFLLAVVVLLLGALVLFPRMKRVMLLMDAAPPGPPPPEVLRLMKPMPLIGMLGMVLVFVILGLMVAGMTGAY